MGAKEFTWTTNDQIKIYGKDWSIPSPKAVIALVHGMGEHCNRYNHLAQFFNEQGFAVVGYDRRGHGQSEGKRGHTPNYQAFLDEITQLLSHTRQRYAGIPLFLYGHSMGGNLVLRYTIKHQPDIKGVVATGAWLKLAKNPPALLIWIGKLMRLVYPAFTQPSGLDASGLATDSSVAEEYLNDPLVHDKISSQTGLSMMEQGVWLNQYKGNFPVPLLLMHGSDDPIVAAAPTPAFAERAQGDISVKVWDGLLHEIHNEPQQLEIFQFTLDWLNRYL